MSGVWKWNVKFPLGEDSLGSIKMGLSGGVWIGKNGGIGALRNRLYLLTFGGLLISGLARLKLLGEVLELRAGAGKLVGLLDGQSGERSIGWFRPFPDTSLTSAESRRRFPRELWVEEAGVSKA